MKTLPAPETKVRNRTIEIEVQGDYGYGDGWECVTGAETLEEARALLKDYRENEPGIPFRIRRVRVTESRTH